MQDCDVPQMQGEEVPKWEDCASQDLRDTAAISAQHRAHGLLALGLWLQCSPLRISDAELHAHLLQPV